MKHDDWQRGFDWGAATTVTAMSFGKVPWYLALAAGAWVFALLRSATLFIEWRQSRRTA